MLRGKYRLDARLPSMRCVGYRQVWDMLEGTLPSAELRDRGVFATRQFAKRQLTWLNGFSRPWRTEVRPTPQTTMVCARPLRSSIRPM
jgi:tRNA A37 N6-isopentenylltransferase MiaA